MAGDSPQLYHILSMLIYLVEICSAHPTSGGPYYWSAMLAKPKNAPFASWITGLVFFCSKYLYIYLKFQNSNRLVQSTRSSRSNDWHQVCSYQYIIRLSANFWFVHSFACATFLSTVCTLGTDFVPTPRTTIGIYAAVLVSQGVNTPGIYMSFK